MVRSLFVWSKDLWNGERGQNGDLSTAHYVFADKADEKQKKEWPFCSLYYEEGTADDNGGTPVAFAEKSMAWQGGTLKLRTVRCSYPNGSTKDFTFPDPKSVSQDYDLRQAGQSGQVNYTPLGMKDGVRQGGVSFHVDEIMSMEASADKNREKVKEFLAKQIDAKISGAMNAESMGAGLSIVYQLKYNLNSYVDGYILMAPLCGITDKMKPNYLLKHLLFNLSYIIPKIPLLGAMDHIAEACKNKEFLKKKLHCPYQYNEKVRLNTARECYKLCEYIEENESKFNSPVYLFHGVDDIITDAKKSIRFYRNISSEKKKLYLTKDSNHILTLGIDDDDKRPLEVLNKVIDFLNEL